MPQSLHHNVWKSYAVQLLTRSATFFVPIIVIYWQQHGMSMTDTTVLQSIFALTMIILEVPSGYFADIVGRKNSLVCGSIAMALSMVVYVFSEHFYHFLTAELIIALGLAFISGADSALLYDSLKAIGRESEYKKVFGSATFFYLSAMAVFSIAGGLVADVNIQYPFFLALAGSVLLVPITLSMKEPPRKKPLVAKGHVHHLKEIITEILFRHEKLKWLILYSAFIFSFFMAALWFYQPYFVLCGIEMKYFGFIFAGFNIFAAISSKFAYRLEVLLGGRMSLALICLVLSAGYFLMGNVIFSLSFLFGLTQQFVRGFYRVVSTDYINQLTRSDIRATVLSIQSMASGLLYALIMPCLGILSDTYDIATAFTTMGIVVLIFGGGLFMILDRKKVFHGEAFTSAV